MTDREWPLDRRTVLRTTGAGVLGTPALADRAAAGTAAGEQRWRFQTDDTSSGVQSSPTVVDGTAFVGSWDNNVYAVDVATGDEQWRFSTDGEVSSSPTVVEGVVFVGSNDSRLYALDAATGDELWRFETGAQIESAPTVSDGLVFVGSWDDNLYAVDAAFGDEQWRFETGDTVRSSPTVADGTVFVGSNDGRLYAVDAATGDELWRLGTDGEVISSPTVADGTVFVGSDDRNVYAVDAATGEEQWRSGVGYLVRSSPTVLDGTLYVADTSVHALDADDGTEQWSGGSNYFTSSSPTVADDTVFYGSGDDNVYALDAATGDEKWRFETGRRVDSSPTVVDGTVFVGSNDGGLYAIGAGVPDASDGSRVSLGTLGHHRDWANEAGGGTAFTLTPTTPRINETVTFDASATAGDSYQWEFGDGTTATGSTVDHTYAAVGDYDVVLTVESGGETEQVSRTVSVAEYDDDGDAGVTAAFDYAPAIPTPEETVTFDAGLASGAIDSYEWDFDDGTTATGRTVTHAFDAAGTYEVELRVADQGADTVDVIEATLDVYADDSTGPSIGTNPSTPTAGDSVSFSTGLGPSDVDTPPEWNFGDGGTASGFQVTHEYADAGTYTVTLDSGAGNSQQELTVEAAPVDVDAVDRDIGGTLLPNVPLEEAFEAEVSTDGDSAVDRVEFDLDGTERTVTTPQDGSYPATFGTEGLSAPGGTLRVRAVTESGATREVTRHVDVLSLPAWLDFLVNGGLGLDVSLRSGDVSLVYDPLEDLLVSFQLPSDALGGGTDQKDQEQSTEFDLGFGASYDPSARTADVEAEGEVSADLMRAAVTADATITGTVETDLELVAASGSLDADAEVDIPSVGPIPLSIPVPGTDSTIGIVPTVAPGIAAQFNFDDELDFQNGTVTPSVDLDVTVGLMIEDPFVGYVSAGLEVTGSGDFTAEFDVGTADRNLGGEIVLSGEVVLDAVVGVLTLDGTLLDEEFGEGVDAESTGATLTGEAAPFGGPNPSGEAAAALAEGDVRTTTRLTDRPYEDTQPTVAPLGENAHVVAWSSQDDAKSAEAGRDVVVRRFEGGSAVSTTRITDDTTADVAPVATALADGRILLAWSTFTFDATEQAFDADAFFDSAEIAFSVFDGDGWSDPQRLTDTARTQQRPTVAAAGDEWVLAWQSIDDDAPATDVRVARVRPDGSTTELDARTAAANPDVAARQDGAVDLAYCTVDSGTTTGVTHERIDDGTVVGTDQYAAAGVRDVVAADGRLAWTLGSGESDPTVVAASGGSKTALTVRDDVTTVSELSLSSAAGDYVLSYRAKWRDSPNRDLVYRLDRGDGWIRDRRIAGGPATDLNLWYSETRFASAETFLTAYAVGEPDPGATDDVFVTRQPFAPAYTVEATATQAAVGEESTVEYTLANRGDTAGSESVTVAVRNGGGETVASRSYDPLAVAGSRTDSVAVAVDETGRFEVAVEAAEPTLSAADSRTEVVAARPALSVGETTATRQSETEATVEIRVRNEGGVPAEDVPVAVADAGGRIAESTAAVVPASGETAVTATVDPTALDRSEPQTVTIAPDGGVAEAAVSTRTRRVHLVRPSLAIGEVRFRRDDETFVEAVLSNRGPGEGRGTVRVLDAASGEALGSSDVAVPPGAPEAATFETCQVATPGLTEGDAVRVVVEPAFGSRETKALGVETDVEAVLPGTLVTGAAAYTDASGVVDTDGLRRAVDDWRGGEIDTDLLRNVIEYWRSGDPVE